MISLSMSDCLFCKIIRREIPSYTLYEDEWTYAFLDISPVHPGHALIVPKTHVTTVLDAEEKVLTSWILATQKVARAICATVGVSHFNLLQNNGSDAGQVVPHLHMHVIPRHADDGLKHWPHGKDLATEEMQDLAQRIRLFNQQGP